MLRVRPRPLLRVRRKALERVRREPIGRVRRNGHWLAAVLMVGPVLVMPRVHGSDAVRPQLYELTTETSMPHLEENLRYANTTRRQCLALSQLTTAFPILRHPALQGCRLAADGRAGDVAQPQSLSYQLVCAGGHGTTGAAVWHLDEHRLRGTLDIKLGGKNMTFFQRITAIPLGSCS
ncbi:MAG: hypothetical protein ACJ8R9_16030 [Steroidobacteraceae bacterium]